MSDTLSSAFAADPMAQNRVRRSRIVESLMKQSMDTTPIRGHAQGLSRLAHALVGTLGQRQLDTEAADAKAQSDQEISDYQQRTFGASAPAAPAMAAAPPPQMHMQQAPAPARMGAVMPPAPALSGANARTLNQQAAMARDAIMNDLNLTPEQQSAALAKVSESRLVANGTPPRPGAFGGARGPWDDGLPAPSGAVNPMMLAASNGQPSNVRFPTGSRPAMPPGAAPPPAAAAPSAPSAPAGNSEAELANIQNGLNSRNPQVRQMAQNDLAIYNARRRDAPPTYPIVQTIGPQGEGQYERTPQGLKYVGPIVREPKESPQTQTREMVVNGVPGIYTVGRDGRPIDRVGEPYQPPQQPPQPSENERMANQWRELEKKRATVGLTQDEQLAFNDLSRMRQRPEQVAAGPTGIAIIGPAPLPQYGASGGDGGGLTVPMLNPAPGQAQPGLVTQPPMSQQPVAGSPMPGSDASGMPPVGARPGMNMTTPGGRPINVQPAPQQPPTGYQRGADQSALEPIPGSPADPAVMIRAKALQSVPEAEAGANRVLDAINNFRAALDRAKGTTGLQVFNPRSPEGKDLQGAFELVKIALRDPTMINTGVLQPGEVKMIDQMLMNPRSLEGLMAGNDAYKAMLDQFAGFAQRGADRVRGVAGMSPIDWTQPRQGVTQGPNQAGRLRYNPATGRIE
jgi:hypothetical protein